MAITLATNARNASTNAVVDLLDAGAGAGTLQIRSGVRPANPDTAATGTLLATMTFEDPAYGNSATGSAALADPDAVLGVAAGTATWFRTLDSDANPVWDGSVTATGGGGDLTLATVAITVGLSIDITSGSYTMPSGE